MNKTAALPFVVTARVKIFKSFLSKFGLTWEDFVKAYQHTRLTRDITFEEAERLLKKGIGKDGFWKDITAYAVMWSAAEKNETLNQPYFIDKDAGEKIPLSWLRLSTAWGAFWEEIKKYDTDISFATLFEAIMGTGERGAVIKIAASGMLPDGYSVPQTLKEEVSKIIDMVLVELPELT